VTQRPLVRALESIKDAHWERVGLDTSYSSNFSWWASRSRPVGTHSSP
jgi:hypothetical protein